MWIEHNRFGKGNVTRVEGEKQNQKVTIEFESVGMKKILLKFAKMRIIQG